MAVIQHHQNFDHVHQYPGRPSRDCSPDYLTMAVDHHQHLRPATPDRASRSSFSSIREDESTLTQDFTRSKVSSFLDHEEVIDDAAEHTDFSVKPPQSTRHSNMIQTQTQTLTQTQFLPPVTHPQSRLLGYYAPAEDFRGWKQIQVKGKLASKSFGDLQVLNNVWTTPLKLSKLAKKGADRPGEAPIERLPPEILSKPKLSLPSRCFKLFLLCADNHMQPRLSTSSPSTYPPMG